MSKYKMITCDLDGTLMGSNSRISEENVKAIHEIVKKGVPFVPCSGRTLSEMREMMDNSDIRYIIYSAGAAILDKKTGEKIENGLSLDIKEELLEILSEFDYFPFLHAEGECYVDKAMRGMEREYNLNDVLCYNVENLAFSVEGFKDFFLNTEAEYISVFFKNSEDHRKCREALKRYEKVVTAEPWAFNLEIFNKKAGKGTAIEILAKRLGIDTRDVISVGDSDNDISALKATGLSIAVSNGSEEIKKIADEIACSNDEHVAQYILKKYFS